MWIGLSLSNNSPNTVFDKPTAEEIEYQQQIAVFENLNADRPVMTPEQRADKINALFGE